MFEFADSDLGQRYPATVSTWENAWERFIPFLEFPPELRRIIYTTNAIESLNYQLRKIIKNRGHFPSDDAVIKLLRLGIGEIEDEPGRQLAKGIAAGSVDGGFVVGHAAWVAAGRLVKASSNSTGVRRPSRRWRRRRL